MLPNERRRCLAQAARRSTNQGLERRQERKFPILLAFVAQAAVEQLDEVVALFDQAVSARESRGCRSSPIPSEIRCCGCGRIREPARSVTSPRAQGAALVAGLATHLIARHDP